MTFLQYTATIVCGTPRVIDIESLGSDAIRRPHLKVGGPVFMLLDLGRKLMGQRPYPRIRGIIETNLSSKGCNKRVRM